MDQGGPSAARATEAASESVGWLQKRLLKTGIESFEEGCKKISCAKQYIKCGIVTRMHFYDGLAKNNLYENSRFEPDPPRSFPWFHDHHPKVGAEDLNLVHKSCNVLIVKCTNWTVYG